MLESVVNHFRITAGLWLVLGAIGFLVTSLHAATMGGFVYRIGGPGALAVEILTCAFMLAATVAGYGLLCGWDWPRLALEILGAVLFTFSLVGLFFSEVVIKQRVLVFIPALLFATYSLFVTLFLKHEGRRA
jgi:hypothetical protein